MPRDSDFVRHFESKALLDELLGAAGSELVTEDVMEIFAGAAADGELANQVIPSLFDGEPRFADPSLARRLYQNLLGLWDKVASGERVDLSEEKPRRPREKKKKAEPPPPFGKEGPDETFVERAWQYLEDLDKRDKDRLLHTFENRQDALLAFLDEQALSDEAYACARFLLFELFAMLEIGLGTRQVSEALLAGRERPQEPAPTSLAAYADEAVFEAEQDDEAPLSPADAAKVRDVVSRGLTALWNARKHT